MSKIPKKDVIILLREFNAQIGKEKEYRETTGIHSAHKTTFVNSFISKLCQQPLGKQKQKTLKFT